MRINLLGVSVDCQKKGEALRYVQERIAQKRPTRIYTPNPVIIQTAARNPVFRDVLNRADLNLPDGSGLLLAARILSLPLSERVAGIEFAEALLALAQQNGYGVFLFGGKPGVAHAAASRLKQRFPNLRICGARHGYFDEKHSPMIAKQIQRSGANILLVGLGAPRQEFWIHHHMPRGVSVAMGVGGSLDVWAGTVCRAPAFLSALGLEWLWRMILEPHRAKNLPHMVAFLSSAVAKKAKMQKPV